MSSIEDFNEHEPPILFDFYEHNSESYSSVEQAANSEDFKLVLEMIASKDHSPDGEVARALVAIGRREPEWDWNVGETPTF